MFTGFLRVPQDGVYTLFVSSDDGSRLYLGDNLVVDNDGLHGQSEASGLAALSAGLHPIRIAYFNATGGEGLIVSWQGPGLAKQAVPANGAWPIAIRKKGTRGEPGWMSSL